MDALPWYEVEYRLTDRLWTVRRNGHRRASSLHSTQSAAEDAARLLARRQQCDVVVKGSDGSPERRYEHNDAPPNRSGVIRLPRGTR